MVPKMPLIFFCAMAQILSVVKCSTSGGTTAFETVPPVVGALVSQSDAVVLNRTRMKKTVVVKQHGSIDRQIRGNPFERFDLIGEETAMVRGTCAREMEQNKNLNEQNTNLNEQNTNLNEQNTNLNDRVETLRSP